MENLLYNTPIMKNTNTYTPIIATAIQDMSWGVKAHLRTEGDSGSVI